MHACNWPAISELFMWLISVLCTRFPPIPVLMTVIYCSFHFFPHSAHFFVKLSSRSHWECMCKFSAPSYEKRLSRTLLRRFAIMWLPAYAGGVVVVVIVVRHKVRQSYVSTTVWPTITKFCANLYTGLVFNHTGYDVNIFFLLPVGSDWILKKPSKMPHPMASLSYISRTVWASTSTCPTFPPDMTSLTTCDRKLPRKTRRNCRLRRLQVEFLEKGVSEDHQISHSSRRKPAPQICWIRHHYLLPIGCKIQLNIAQKWCVIRVRLAKESNNSATV